MPPRGDNRLAGAPPQVVSAQADYRFSDAWSMQGALRWNPQQTPVDNMNTLYAGRYVVVDLRARCRLSDRVTLFGEITNVFNENYASSTLVVDQALPDQAVFMPGDGRGFFAGLIVRF